MLGGDVGLDERFTAAGAVRLSADITGSSTATPARAAVQMRYDVDIPWR
jgi:hypothetical protein